MGYKSESYTVIRFKLATVTLAEPGAWGPRSESGTAYCFNNPKARKGEITKPTLRGLSAAPPHTVYVFDIYI